MDIGNQSDARGRRGSRPWRDGFTLLEVILGLLVMSLLAGMVWAIIQTTLRAALTTEIMQQDRERVYAFFELMRRSFDDLPEGAVVTLVLADRGTPLRQELTFSFAPRTFAYGWRASSEDDTTIGLLLDGDRTGEEARYVVGFTRPGFEDEINDDPMAVRAQVEGIEGVDGEGRYWVPLLRGVEGCDWGVWSDETEQFELEWDGTGGRPRQIECKLWLEGRERPYRAVFAVPPVPEVLTLPPSGGDDFLDDVLAGGVSPGGVAEVPGQIGENVGGGGGGQGGGGGEGGGGRGERGGGGGQQGGPGGGGPGGGGGQQGGPGGGGPGGGGAGGGASGGGEGGGGR